MVVDHDIAQVKFSIWILGKWEWLWLGEENDQFDGTGNRHAAKETGGQAQIIIGEYAGRDNAAPVEGITRPFDGSLTADGYFITAICTADVGELCAGNGFAGLQILGVSRYKIGYCVAHWRRRADRRGFDKAGDAGTAREYPAIGRQAPVEPATGPATAARESIFVHQVS